MPGDSKKGDLGVVEDAAKQIGTALAALEYRIVTPLQNELQFNSQAQAALDAFVSASGRGVKNINAEFDLALRSVWSTLDGLVAALAEAKQEIADLQQRNNDLASRIKAQGESLRPAVVSHTRKWVKAQRPVKRGNGRPTAH
jgi:hypothetical protein